MLLLLLSLSHIPHVPPLLMHACVWDHRNPTRALQSKREMEFTGK